MLPCFGQRLLFLHTAPLWAASWRYHAPHPDSSNAVTASLTCQRCSEVTPFVNLWLADSCCCLIGHSLLDSLLIGCLDLGHLLIGCWKLLCSSMVNLFSPPIFGYNQRRRKTVLNHCLTGQVIPFGSRISSDFVCIFCFQLVSTAWWLRTGIWRDFVLHCVKHQNGIFWHSVTLCETKSASFCVLASFDQFYCLSGVEKKNSLNVTACACVFVCVCVCVCVWKNSEISKHLVFLLMD